jgi:hypothetical protein
MDGDKAFHDCASVHAERASCCCSGTDRGPRLKRSRGLAAAAQAPRAIAMVIAESGRYPAEAADAAKTRWCAHAGN